MIQIRIAPDERYSLSEMAQMAVEGGCGWIVLAMPGADPGEWRDVGAELVPLCRDAAVALGKADIDYLTIAPSCGDPKALIAASRTGGAEVPFVAVCSADDVIANSASYLADGFAGFYVTGAVFDAADPVAVVGQLQKLR